MERIMERIMWNLYHSKRKLPFLILLLGGVLLLKTDFAHAATKTPLATGLSAAVGAAVDEAKNQLYFVEYNPSGNGKLKRINLPPQCTPLCTPAVVASGFSHPEDVQLDLAHGLAYVTTRDDPGTTGALWKVDIATGIKNMVTFNLGAPQQLVLDTANNQAYTVGYDDGKLRRIDLTTGAKTPVFSGLGHPVGIAITRDRKYAYITEQNGGLISRIDLTMGTKDPIPAATGLTAPFFLSWTDESQNSLYVAERDPANKVTRVDLATATKYDAITETAPSPSWWWRPTGIIVSGPGTPVYVTTDKAVVRVDMADMGSLLSEPVFIAVGHVPSTKINSDGYATTDPGYFFQVKDSPFGGTLNVFGNLSKFKQLGAAYYQVQVKKDSGTFAPLNLSWNAYRFNTATGVYELVPVAPDASAPNPASGPKYKIPPEYPLNAARWVPPFLMMRWPSGENGLYEFTVRIFNAGGIDITSAKFLPTWKNSLKIRIDNTPPDVKLSNICQKGTSGGAADPCHPDKEVKPCDIVSAGSNQYYFKITAYDINHHLLSYGLIALWGNNQSASIASDSYSAHVSAEGPYLWSGVANAKVPAAPWNAQCNCAHTFYLGAWKRTINGYNYILYRDHHRSVTINNTGSACP